MSFDLKAHSWGYDIRAFARYQNMFRLLGNGTGDFYDRHREYLRENMRKIQQRWPQFIKEDEIP